MRRAVALGHGGRGTVTQGRNLLAKCTELNESGGRHQTEPSMTLHHDAANVEMGREPCM